MSDLSREEKMNQWVNKDDTASEPAPPAAPPATSPSTPAAAAPAPSGEAAPTGEAPAAPAAQGGPSDWIVAKRGTEEFRIPADAVLEFKRRDQTLTASMDEFRRSGMMGTDYRLSKEQLAAERQRFQQEQEQEAVAKARLAEREKFLGEQEQAFRAAQTDPAQFDQWQTHFQQMQSNPMYRNAFEAQMAKRETDAENAVLRERAEVQYIERAKATVDGWTEALAAKYPGISLEAVQRDYAAQVTLHEQRTGQLGRLGEGPLTPQALEAVFQHHAGIAARTMEPVNQRIAGLEAELKALKDQKAVEAQNAQTTHAVRRAAAPSTVPTRGAPAPEGPKKPKYESEDERQARMAAWATK